MVDHSVHYKSFVVTLISLLLILAVFNINQNDEKEKREDIVEQAEIIQSTRHSLLDQHSSHDYFHCDKWAVVLLRQAPTIAVEKQAHIHEWCLVMVQGEGAPSSIDLQGDSTGNRGKKHVFLGLPQQQEMISHYSFLADIPLHHAARKNFGYLFALLHGARVLWDFDDDIELISRKNSLPAPGFPDQHSEPASVSSELEVEEPKAYDRPVLNPYPLLGVNIQPSWPRGLPLVYVNDSSFREKIVQTAPTSLPVTQLGVMQFLANHEPDADDLYRAAWSHEQGEEGALLQMDFPIRGFPPVLVPRCRAEVEGCAGVYTAVNSHASMHFHSALWALLLPVGAGGKEYEASGASSSNADVWRGYIAQRIFRFIGARVVIHPPIVTHIHSETDDSSGSALYKTQRDLLQREGTASLVTALEEWRCRLPVGGDPSKPVGLPWCVLQLWQFLREHQLISEADVRMVGGWLDVLMKTGYRFPIYTEILAPA